MNILNRISQLESAIWDKKHGTTFSKVDQRRGGQLLTKVDQNGGVKDPSTVVRFGKRGGMMPFKMPGSPPKKAAPPPAAAPPKIPGLPVPVLGKAPPKLPSFMVSAEEDRDKSPPRKPQKTKKVAPPPMPGKPKAARKLFE